VPSTLPSRRARGFRPLVYKDRHRLVATLLALGFCRREIGEIVRYSPSHVSRVASMPRARADVAFTFALLLSEQLRATAIQTVVSPTGSDFY
jgi:hypothetical protein